MDKEITALTAQKKNPNRINVFLDGEFAFGLARIVAAWLRVGQLLTVDQIERLKDQDTFEVAYQKGLHFLSYRARSESEVQKKLRDQGFEEVLVDAVIERLKGNGILGDHQFARDWVENRSTFRPRSKRLMTLELRQKGVAEEEIQKALANAGDENSLAYQTAVPYLRRLAGTDWGTFRKKMAGFLSRRGFSYGTMEPILHQLWEEMQSSADGENPMLNEENKLWK